MHLIAQYLLAQICWPSQKRKWQFRLHSETKVYIVNSSLSDQIHNIPTDAPSCTNTTPCSSTSPPNTGSMILVTPEMLPPLPHSMASQIVLPPSCQLLLPIPLVSPITSLVPRRPLPLSQKGGLVSIDAFLGPNTLAISKSGSPIRSQNNQSTVHVTCHV